MSKNYYKTLEVDSSASQEVIEKAYKALAKKYHPDLQEESQKEAASEKLKEINEAYEILSNPESRANFDKTLKASTISEEDFNKMAQENQILYNELNNLKNEKNNRSTNPGSTYNSQINYNTTQNSTNQDLQQQELAKQMAAQEAYEKELEYQEEMQRARQKAYHDAYIQDLMVCPDYQGKGIGTDLMDKMIEYLKKKRIYMISVVYEECLKPFYERFGFYNMLCGQMETY